MQWTGHEELQTSMVLPWSACGASADIDFSAVTALQTLLDTLAGRRGTSGVRGEIRVNGMLASPAEIQAASGYVLQVGSSDATVWRTDMNQRRCCGISFIRSTWLGVTCTS